MLAAITTAALYHCISLGHHCRYNAIMLAAITTAALYHCINLCHHCRYNAIMLAAITVTALYQSRSSPQVQRNHACSNNHSCTLSVCVITKCTRFEANHMELFYVIFLWLCITTCAMHCNAWSINHKELSSCPLCHLAVALFITVTYSSFCSNSNSLGTWHL